MSAGRRDRPLTRPELLEAALRIVDTEGLRALTMRRLAEAVGVEAMSLYNHVPNKEVLLDWTLELMRSEMKLPEPRPADWADLMKAIFSEYRRVLAAHPNMLPLAGRRTSGVALEGLRFLLDQGFALDDAVELYQSLLAFTVGYSMLSAPGVQIEFAEPSTGLVERALDWQDATCDRTLQMILDGYRSRLGTTAGGGRVAG